MQLQPIIMNVVESKYHDY